MGGQAAVHHAPRRCRHVVAPPLRKDREEAQGAYKRRRSTTVAKDRILILAWLHTRKEEEDQGLSFLASTIAIREPSASSLYCVLHKQ